MKRQIEKLLLSVIITIFVSACGGDVGPSNEKIELDYKERFQNAYKNVLLIKEFEVKNRKQLSEDRIDVEATAIFYINEKMEKEIMNYRSIGYEGHPFQHIYRKVKRQPMGNEEKFTLHYRINPNSGVWVIQ